AIPQQVGATPIEGVPRYQETNTSDTRVSVRSPISGVVAARNASVGGTVAQGQSIFAVVDPTRVWVNASIEETKGARVEPGQPVEVPLATPNPHFPPPPIP